MNTCAFMNDKCILYTHKRMCMYECNNNKRIDNEGINIKYINNKIL